MLKNKKDMNENVFKFKNPKFRRVAPPFFVEIRRFLKIYLTFAI